MADTRPFKAELLYDNVGVFDLGVNMGREPLSLPKNQLGRAINATMRFDFITNRPPFSKNLNIIWPSTAVQTAVEKGLFQGMGYYQPDSGNQSLFASISGRLFQFLLNGNDVTVIERTIPGDPNPAASTQVWIWQAEKWLIVNDGTNLPIFFDGETSRRSNGPSNTLNTATATIPAGLPPPLIGQSVLLALSNNWLSSYSFPVLFNGAYYQPIAGATGESDVTLVSLFSNLSEPINIDDPISLRPNLIGVVANGINGLLGNNFIDGNGFQPGYQYWFVTPANATNLTIILTEPYTGIVDPRGEEYRGGSFRYSVNTESLILLFGKVWQILSASGNNINVIPYLNNNGTFSSNLLSGTEIQKVMSSEPNSTVGFVAVATAAPTTGGNINVTLKSAYTGPAGAIVYLGTGQYEIYAVPSIAPGTAQIRLVNLSDTSIQAYVFNPQPYNTPINTLPILSVPELPAGRMGAYGLGQNWMVLTDGISFICSDISRGPSGTPPFGRRDSVLKTTDLTFRGGNFSIPGAGNVISSITFTANLDVSLGQGSLEVGTPSFMASCLAPFDFSSLTYSGPILVFSLIGSGPLAQNSTIRVNSDIYFRSVSGLGSLVRARRDFQSSGNVPISNEVMTYFELDDDKLLPYGSATVFNNRFLATLSPQATSQGVLHAGLIALNLDPNSGVRDKQPAVYDGLWTGINVMQLLTGNFSGVERCFAFTYNVALTKIELYELLPSDDNNFDNGTIPITWRFETASLFNKDVKPEDVMVSLRDGEFAVSDVLGTVRFEVFYKMDQGCWTPWHSFSICADTAGEPQYFPRLGLGEPSSNSCDPILNTPLRDGYTCQVAFQITGHCRFLRARFAAVTLPNSKFEPPICDVFATVTT